MAMNATVAPSMKRKGGRKVEVAGREKAAARPASAPLRRPGVAGGGVLAAAESSLRSPEGATRRGDSKGTFYIGPAGDDDSHYNVNQWPPEECFPSWKKIMLSYHANALAAGKRILSLIALSLDLDAEFFQKNGGFEIPTAVLRLLHYGGDINASDDRNIGAAAHSDYGMLTLLATDDTPGLHA
ncbi:1-aminocyclopropane-1-carboxylate oxidase-like [Panicum miliaceum]|uniref:1-aminocyclopropane-1-carboxylate oxidase-like n=1 Tax=Panicum miliaceum TaxID=4540 RepID=A0A3L6T7H2_PANMI|nr:1-aminocyclopropane-1-carboxylate oxidase-like [Panicum miliaceum]